MKTVTRVAALIGGASVLTIGDDIRRAQMHAGEQAVIANLRLGLAEPERYIREPDNDRRIGRGDDFAGDAWRDRQTGEIKYVAVGHNPNA